MGKRKYFILSLLLVICALCSDFASKGQFSKSTILLGRSFTMSEADRIQAKMESDKFLHKGSTFYYIGIGLAVSSFLFWIASQVCREPTWRLILPALLGIYFLMQFIMV